MNSSIIRYVGRRDKSALRVFQDILQRARRATFDSPTCLGEKKVRITISVEEIS